LHKGDLTQSRGLSAAWIRAYRELLAERHALEPGRHIDEVPTPALVLDLDVASENARKMADFLVSGPVALRPHVKVHKSPEVAAIQMKFGAIGVSTATVSEAAVMLRSGIPDVLIANQVTGLNKIDTVAELAGDGALTVAVDDGANIQALDRAASRRGTQIGVLVEYDVGMGRSGARTLKELEHLIDEVANASSLRLRGLMGYEGHCMSIPDRQQRTVETRAAMARLDEAAAVVDAEIGGCEIVSGGGTGTYFVSGAEPPLTETQAGSYIVMDGYHADLVTEFAQALYVSASVISRHGTLAVLDSGRKAVTTDLKPPDVLRDRTSVAFIHEEHMGLSVDRDDQLRVDDRVRLRPGYGPMTINLYDVYHVVQNDIVTHIWPVLARHPGP
jgi:D-serine deaminase-like pyridoxal phosphate-dependent protein